MQIQMILKCFESLSSLVAKRVYERLEIVDSSIADGAGLGGDCHKGQSANYWCQWRPHPWIFVGLCGKRHSNLLLTKVSFKSSLSTSRTCAVPCKHENKLAIRSVVNVCEHYMWKEPRTRYWAVNKYQSQLFFSLINVGHMEAIRAMKSLKASWFRLLDPSPSVGWPHGNELYFVWSLTFGPLVKNPTFLGIWVPPRSLLRSSAWATSGRQLGRWRWPRPLSRPLPIQCASRKRKQFCVAQRDLLSIGVFRIDWLVSSSNAPVEELLALLSQFWKLRKTWIRWRKPYPPPILVTLMGS